jgi:hypothetical protein
MQRAIGAAVNGCYILSRGDLRAAEKELGSLSNRHFVVSCQIVREEIRASIETRSNLDHRGERGLLPLFIS